METVVIKQNQKKQFLLVILGIIMTFAGIFVLITGLKEKLLIDIIIGILGTMFFGACLFFIVNRFIHPIEILIIDDRGITDNSTATSVGFIGWMDIEDIFITSQFMQKFISIKLKEESNILNKNKGLNKGYLKFSNKYFKSHISITLQASNTNINEILDLLLIKLNNFRNNA